MVKRVRAIGIIFVSIIGHNGLETKKYLKGTKNGKEKEQIVTTLIPYKVKREDGNNLVVHSFRNKEEIYTQIHISN